MLQLLLHGPPRVTAAGGRERRLSPREAALLAWLHLEGPTPRPVLAGQLWPDGGDARARANLRQLLVRLRRGVGALLEEADGLLRLAPQVCVLAPAGERLLGPLEFDDLPGLADWLARRREAEQRERLRRLLAAARAASEAGDLDAALGDADAALAIEPALEEAHRLRMQLLYLRGDRAAAIAAWDDCRLALRRAFGVAPSAATAELGQFLLSAAAEAAPATARVLPAALRRPPRLAGRAALLAALQPALAAGGAVLLTGPAGSGKSRLAEQLLPEGPTRLRVAARLGDAVDPGALLQRLLVAVHQRFAPGHALPQVDAALPLRSPLAHRAWQASLAGLFDAAVAAGLRQLLVEDLHHADEASLAALLPLCGHWLDAAAPAGAGAVAGLQLLATTRLEGLPDAGRALLDALAAHGRVTVQAVPPLDAAALAELLDDPAVQPLFGLAPAHRSALARALCDAVGGHPAFVLELLRQQWLAGAGTWQPGQALQAPPSLLAALQQRLRQLPDEPQQLAQLAAVAEGDFDAELAAAALQRPLLALAPALQALEQAQVFQGGRFGHDLMAQAVQALLPPLLRAPLHRRVAGHLAGRGGRAARVAHHLAAAGEPAAAAPWWLQAADDARARWQQAEAAALYGRAAAALDPRRERRRALRAWCEAARAWAWVDDPAAAAQAVQAARALAETADERAMVLARSAAQQLKGRALPAFVASAVALLDELDAGAQALPPGELAYALRLVCVAVQHGGPPERARAQCEAAGAAMRAAEPEVQATWAVAYGGLLHWLARPREAATVLAQARTALGPDGDPAARLSVLDQLMRVRHSLGDLAGALEAAQALQPLLRLADAGLVYECDLLHVRGNLLAAQGRAAEGLACHEAIARRLAAAGLPMREVFAVSRVHVALAAGRPDLAAEALAEVPRAPGTVAGPLADQARWWATARLRQARGEPWQDCADALAALAGADALPPGPALFGRVVLATLQAPPPTAWAALVEDLRARGYAALARLACLGAARARRAAGEAAEAWRWAAQALVLAPCVDAWADTPATVWAVAADAADAAGHPAEAAAARARGRDWVLQGLAQWPDDAARAAWCRGEPAHAALLRAPD